MLLHIVVKLLRIILLLLHHYYVLLWLLLRIIILLLHYYYVIITHYYGAIITYYYVITIPLLPISTRSIIGNNGAIITYYWPVEFADVWPGPERHWTHQRWGREERPRAGIRVEAGPGTEAAEAAVTGTPSTIPSRGLEGRTGRARGARRPTGGRTGTGKGGAAGGRVGRTLRGWSRSGRSVE